MAAGSVTSTRERINLFILIIVVNKLQLMWWF